MRHLEGYILPNDPDVNVENLKAVRAFVGSLGAPSAEKTTEQALVWKAVSGRAVMTLLRSFSFSPAHGDLGPINGNVSLFMDYFSDRLRDEMSEWDVAIPHPSGGTPTPDLLAPGLSFTLRKRESGDVVDGGFRVTGGRNRVADPNDAQIGLDADQIKAGDAEKASDRLRGDKAYCAQRVRPLMLIHVFTTDETMKGMKLKGPVVTLSFCLPGTSKPANERVYQVSTVYRRQIEEVVNAEIEDDEGMLVEHA